MKFGFKDLLLVAGLAACASALRAQAPVEDRLSVGIGKTYLLDTTMNIERLMVSSPEVAEAVVINPRTAAINGRSAGETSLILWLADGTRRQYDLSVNLSTTRLDAVNQQLKTEFSDQQVHLDSDGLTIYLRGTVRDMFASGRAALIAESAGKVINLLNVNVPPEETQILIKVRFANVDRSKSRDLAINFFSAAKGWPLSVTTGGSAATKIASIDQTTGQAGFSLADALNLFLFNPHLDAGATIKALEGKNMLQLLAEPNILAMNGKEATFTSGGQFPYPTIQGGGGGLGQVTVAFREFGIRIRVLPVITPRGTIQLHISPEVSSLDYANSLTTQGATVPGISTRRVDTDIELQDGQTFAIAGLLDQRTTESLSKIPGIGDIPIIGKLFQSKTIQKSNSELIILVTPELVTAIPAGQPIPDLERPMKFLDDKGVMTTPPQTPGPEQTGTPASIPSRKEIPIEEMQQLILQSQVRQSTLAAGAYQDAQITGGGSAGLPPSLLSSPVQNAAPAPSASAPASAGAPAR